MLSEVCSKKRTRMNKSKVFLTAIPLWSHRVETTLLKLKLCDIRTFVAGSSENEITYQNVCYAMQYILLNKYYFNRSIANI